MKSMKNYLFVLLLVVFSFYYTNKIMFFLKETDPIMKEIKMTEGKYRVEADNAKIIGNSIVSGKNGKTIDYDESYQKMKKYGAYNESLTSLKDTKAVISIDDYYDKYVVRGNSYNRNVSLVFEVDKDTDIRNILSILDEKEVVGTFFLDGEFIEDNVSLIRKNRNHEYELLSYQNKYQDSLFKTSLSYLESITKKEAKYCYCEVDNEELLKLCGSLKLHTIKPSLIFNKDIYREVKKSLDNSVIISLSVNPYVEKELAIVIDYIKSKGYKIVSLDELVSENN